MTIYRRVSARQTLTKFLMITALLLSVRPHITFFASSTTSESYKEVKYTYMLTIYVLQPCNNMFMRWKAWLSSSHNSTQVPSTLAHHDFIILCIYYVSDVSHRNSHRTNQESGTPAGLSIHVGVLSSTCMQFSDLYTRCYIYTYCTCISCQTLNYVVIYLLINQLHHLINELKQLLVFNISLPQLYRSCLITLHSYVAVFYIPVLYSCH